MENNGASQKKIEFEIKGMTCAVCADTCERALKKAGASDAYVNFANKKASLTVPVDADERVFYDAVKSAGYKPVEKKDARAEKNAAVFAAIRVFISLAFAAVLLYFAMAPMIGLPAMVNPDKMPRTFAAVQIALVVPVAACGYRFYTAGFKNLFRLRPNMDSLVAVGTASALIYSLYAAIRVFSGEAHFVHSLYFESAAVIIALIMLGKTLEARALRRTGDAVEKLMGMTPKTAVRVRPDGSEEIVSIADIAAGDVLRLKEGGAVAVDGKVVSGETSINEAMLTGESLPRDKTVGDRVFAGTVNFNGTVDYRAEKIGRDTVISQIVKAVEDAQGSKARAAKAADKAAGIFTPVAMAIALIAFIVWLAVSKDVEKALTSFVSVLVISCPCALGLATPTAIIVGTGKAASKGVLFKNADAIENLARVKIAAFDKTGTLTEGAPRVERTEFFVSEELALSCAAAAERPSAHPLARAIVAYAEQKGVNIPAASAFEATAGFGVVAEVEGMRIMLGKPSFFSDFPQIGDDGGSVVAMTVDGKPAAAFVISDEIKKDAPAVIGRLKRQGVSAVLITGDNARAAKKIADYCGIDEVFAEVLPNDKAETVKKLKSRGSVVFVGDGVNDAPALAVSDAGIAVSGGTDVAIDSADAALTGRGIAGVSYCIALSKAVMRNVKQNLGWAFVYNAVGIPIAAGVLYPAFSIQLSPMIAALAMSLSSVSVVLNALRLNLFKEKYKMEKRVIFVEGMSCRHCEARVESALGALDGVKKVKASAKDACVKVSFDPEKTGLQAVLNAVEQAGYKPSER